MTKIMDFRGHVIAAAAAAPFLLSANFSDAAEIRGIAPLGEKISADITNKGDIYTMFVGKAANWRVNQYARYVTVFEGSAIPSKCGDVRHVRMQYEKFLCSKEDTISPNIRMS